MTDLLDQARFARHYRGTICPICQLDWQCGQDVRERRPVSLNNAAYCATCYLAATRQESDWFDRGISICMSRHDALSTIDQAFLTRIAGLRESEVDEQDNGRLQRLVEKLENAR